MFLLRLNAHIRRQSTRSDGQKYGKNQIGNAIRHLFIILDETCMGTEIQLLVSHVPAIEVAKLKPQTGGGKNILLSKLRRGLDDVS
jgi:hypothetical protein